MKCSNHTKSLSPQAGFTLVELAIVMIIIGLLIGGVLKGQQLITNAQVTATVAQEKAVDAATTSFKDQYSAVPGDMTNPTARIPNCPAAGACSNAGAGGDGDGRVDAAGTAIDFTAAPAGEQIAYWAQLNAAGLLTGINPDTAAVTATAWGQYAPASKITGGGWDVGWYGGGVSLSKQENTAAGSPAPAGEYLALHGDAGKAVGSTATDSFLTPNLAARIDTKIDDGQPNTGTVQAAANTGGSCASGGAITDTYKEAVTQATCSLYVQFQN